MDAEIGVRNLADSFRYNVLPDTIKALGLADGKIGEIAESFEDLLEYERLAMLVRTLLQYINLLYPYSSLFLCIGTSLGSIMLSDQLCIGCRPQRILFILIPIRVKYTNYLPVKSPKRVKLCSVLLIFASQDQYERFAYGFNEVVKIRRRIQSEKWVQTTSRSILASTSSRLHNSIVAQRRSAQLSAEAHDLQACTRSHKGMVTRKARLVYLCKRSEPYCESP